MRRMITLACLNGELLPADEAKVSIWDRGFVFGDGIYEVFRLYQGQMWLHEEHMARLRRSLAEMWYEGFDFDRLVDRIQRTIEVSEIREGIVYIQITRGVAPRRHAFPAPGTPPTELIVIKPYDDEPVMPLRRSGVPVISFTDLRWRRCDVKSINLLGNVLACEAAHRADAFEAILVDEAGLVTEATHSSLLWVRDGKLRATPEGREILPGTTRSGGILRAAEAIHMPFVEERITLDELLAADEVILVGTTIEVMPVRMIDGQLIGNGERGPHTQRLQQAFRNAVQAWLDLPHDSERR